MLKKVYKNSPIFIQNLFVTIENIFVLYKKYGYIPIMKPMKTIAKNVSEKVNLNEPDTLIERINSFIEYAKIHTKYYKNLEKKNIKIKSLKDIQKLPLLEKKVLKQNIQQFYSDEITRYNSRTLYTSGSTGSPMKIKVSVKDLQLRFRLLLKTMIDIGYNVDKPLGRISGHDIADEDIIYRKDYINQHFFLSAFHISDKNIKKYYDVITANNIEALEGYPSAIYLMAKLFNKNGYKISCVKNVFTTAEKLHGYQKEEIEKTFGCKVFDYYGSNEQSIFIFTCTEGKLHTSDVTGVLEVLDDDNNPVKNGESGHMVVTSLTSHFMPLIRYKIGDRCIVSKKQSCSCGNGGVIIEEILGRDEDIFKTIDGKYITRFSVVLKYLPKEIIESQLVLSNKKLLVTLYYVSDIDINSKEFNKFKNNLLSKIGKSYKVEYKKVNKLIKTSKGKMKAVIIEN